MRVMGNRQRNSRGYAKRKVGVREIKQRFLIVCEGTKTEPQYFKGFRVPKVVVDVEGLGVNPSRLVDTARELREKDDYDQVWCVFDRDSFPENDFNTAIQKATRSGFKVAYSNEAFELWYVLHFEFLNAGIPRSDYSRKLSGFLNKTYEKNSDDMYLTLLPKQETAIRNATNLSSFYEPINPVKDNPSTTVHLLVQELNKFMRQGKDAAG